MIPKKLLETIVIRINSGLIIILVLIGLITPPCSKPLQLIGMMSGHSNRSNGQRNAIIPSLQSLTNTNKSLLASPISTSLVILNSIRLDKGHNNLKTSYFRPHYSNLQYHCTLSHQSYLPIYIILININYPHNRTLCRYRFHNNHRPINTPTPAFSIIRRPKSTISTYIRTLIRK